MAVTVTQGTTSTVQRYGYDGDGNLAWRETGGEMELYIGEAVVIRGLSELPPPPPPTSHTIHLPLVARNASGSPPPSFQAVPFEGERYYRLGGAVVGWRVGSSAENVVYWLHGDHLGSIVRVTDENGEQVLARGYDAWGEMAWATGTLTLTLPLGYTGQMYDAETGLLYLHARWYYPGLGRFISADTVVPEPGNPQDLNRYAYTRNNPLNFIDPTGHKRWPGDEDIWTPPELPVGHYLYSEQYGWFDRSHFNTGNPGKVIRDIRQAIADGGGPVHIEQPLGRGPIEGNYIEHYQVSSKATPEDAVGIAFGMYKHWSMGFEQWQSTISVLGIRTAFAIEDLPSHYIGFYAKANGLSYSEVFANLGFVEGTDQEPPRITPWPPWNPSAWNWEVKNVFFTPRVQDGEGNWHNIPWPDAMTITPIGSGSGLWEFRGAECQGNLCGITRP